MDHGLLNIPLAKRGDIDAQIDRYKAEQAAAAKSAARVVREQMKTDRIEAAKVLEGLSDERLARIAQKAKLTAAQARKELKSLAYWSPRKVIALGVSA